MKVRVAAGCFHREHSPEAYALIDERLRSLADGSGNLEFVEHESGPELLVLLELTAAGVTLTASVIGLVAAIIGARREGISRGDQPSEPVELIIRRIDFGETFREERILRVRPDESIDPAQLEALLRAALNRVVEDGGGRSE
jgi:sialic acid synthase SpsE